MGRHSVRLLSKFPGWNVAQSSMGTILVIVLAPRFELRSRASDSFAPAVSKSHPPPSSEERPMF